MKYKKLIDEYLQRTNDLLKYDDEINLTYCALELRRAIELIIWTQFIDAFRRELAKLGMYRIDYSYKLQSKSILIMYELLKKHIKEYTDYGSRKVLIILKSGNALNKKLGVCFIPPELPTVDYRYLSNLLHYEKEIVPKEYRPAKEKLIKIYKRIKFVKNNYSRFLVLNKDINKIKGNLLNNFGLTEDSARTFK